MRTGVDALPYKKRSMRLYAMVVAAGVIITTAAALAAIYSEVYDEDDRRGDNETVVAGTVADVRDSLTLDATYYEGKDVIITYRDATGADIPVTVDVLGMRESYREVFSGPEFSVAVEFSSVPRHGWVVHPVVIEMDHPVFGSIQLKTEIHGEWEPAPRIIYADR